MNCSEHSDLAQALEAILIIADRPVTATEISETLEVPTQVIEHQLTHLAAEYRGENGGRVRGFELRKLATGWRIFSTPQWADVVGKFIVGGHPARLSPAAIETLAIIAYKQPVSRSQISNIRGVNVDGVIRTLLNHDLIAEAGQLPSGAITYRTTPVFLEKMGLSSLDDLPPLAPYLPAEDQLDDLNTEVEAE